MRNCRSGSLILLRNCRREKKMFGDKCDQILRGLLELKPEKRWTSREAMEYLQGFDRKQNPAPARSGCRAPQLERPWQTPRSTGTTSPARMRRCRHAMRHMRIRMGARLTIRCVNTACSGSTFQGVCRLKQERRKIRSQSGSCMIVNAEQKS